MPEFMTEKRLTGIALIHIHYAKTVDLNKVVEMFAKGHPRKIELQSIIFDYYFPICSYQPLMIFVETEN